MDPNNGGFCPSTAFPSGQSQACHSHQGCCDWALDNSFCCLIKKQTNGTWFWLRTSADQALCQFPWALSKIAPRGSSRAGLRREISAKTCERMTESFREALAEGQSPQSWQSAEVWPGAAPTKRLGVPLRNEPTEAVPCFGHGRRCN